MRVYLGMYTCVDRKGYIFAKIRVFSMKSANGVIRAIMSRNYEILIQYKNKNI